MGVVVGLSEAIAVGHWLTASVRLPDGEAIAAPAAGGRARHERLPPETIKERIDPGGIAAAFTGQPTFRACLHAVYDPSGIET